MQLNSAKYKLGENKIFVAGNSRTKKYTHFFLSMYSTIINLWQ